MFRLVKITTDGLWEETLAAWKEQAEAAGDEGVFLLAEIEQKFTWAKALAEQDPNNHCYFLVETGSNIASSLLEFSHAKPKSARPWLKMLRLTLAPPLSVSLVDPSDIEMLKKTFLVVASSVTHAIELIFHTHPSSMLKIYAKDQEMLGFFRSMVTNGTIDPLLDAIELKARLESRWLVLEKTKEA